MYIVTCCYIKNYSKTWQLKKKQHLWSHKIGGECGCVLWIRVSHKAAVKVQLFQGSAWGRTWLQAHCGPVDSLLVLTGCWLETSIPCHLSCSIGLLTTLQIAPFSTRALREKNKRWWSRRKSRSFCNLISEGILHYFCGIVFIRSKLLDTSHTQGERIVQWHEYDHWETS